MVTRSMKVRSPQETVLDGLLPKISIREVNGGVFIEEDIDKNSYLMEYKLSETYPRANRQAHESEYE